HSPRRGIDPLLDGGVRDLLHQDAYLHSASPLGLLVRMLSLRAVDGRVNQAPRRPPSMAPRMKSTIAWVGAPGVNTSATPRLLSSGMSSAGMVPPTVITTSFTPCSRSSSTTRGTSVMCAPER